MDVHTKEQRSKNMKAIRSKNTRMEVLVSKYLWNNGIRFRKNVKGLFGKPDIAIKKYKVAIFLDSCFWHKCPKHFIKPSTNIKFWEDKIAANVARDLKVNEYYKNNGWYVLRIWEHEIKKDFDNTMRKIIKFIKNTK